MTEITYFRHKHFDKALNQARLGGPSRKNANRVLQVLGSLDQPDPFWGLKQTNHGESRIPKCVKYDLGDGWRLVSVQDKKTCGFIFLGTHDEVDKFLDTHKGTRFAIQDGKLIAIPGAGLIHEHGHKFSASNPTVFVELLGEDQEYVLGGLPINVFRAIDKLDSASPISEIQNAVVGIQDEKRKIFVAEILALLSSGNEDGWKLRIAYERGEILDTDDADPDLKIIVEDGDQIRGIIIGSAEYERYMAAFERETPWHDWFLYLHPEQERVVNRDYEGTAQLSGVSGSGKTCVLVRRATRLASQSDARILILTLNRSLAGLLQKLVNACTTKEEGQRIRVTSFFELARELLIEFEPGSGQSLAETSWILSEHVDEVFREYFRRWLNNSDAKVLEPLQLQLTARGVCAENYLREEFDWIRSATTPSNRDEYLKMERLGRRVPIPEERRKDILSGLRGWESKMANVGVVDYLAMSDLLSTRLDKLTDRFDHVLIDEAQDFGTTELSIVRRLVQPGPNDIFLCGDIAQTVLPKHRQVAAAGLLIGSRDRIRQNYRNSREILNAAYQLLINNLDEDLFEDEGLELLDPKFANFSSGTPLALFATSLEEELAFARTYARERLLAGAQSVCIAFAGYTARDVEGYADACGVSCLNGFYDPLESPIVFSDLEQTKGYEFEILIIVNCCEGVLPAVGAPEEEAFRQGCKLYVAMTRARRELILSFNGEASPWLIAVANTIQVEEWANYEELDASLLAGVPECLPEFSDQEAKGEATMMTGAEYLFTNHAIGLSVDAQQKLLELVDGRGALNVTGKRVRWATLGDLAKDFGRSKQHDNYFGPKLSEEIRENIAAAFPNLNLFPQFRTLTAKSG